MLRSTLAGAVASVAAGVGFAGRPSEQAAAKKKRCKPKPLNTPCASNKECCCQTNRICSTPNCGAPGVTGTVCCGSKGATCESDVACCFGYVCNPVTGQCEEGPC